MAQTQLTGKNILDGSVSLTADVTGTLPVGNGGTGAATLTGILKGNGTSAVTAVTAPSGAIVGDTDTQTLTNKRHTPRSVAVTYAATMTINTDTTDIANITMTGDGTLLAPSGTPTEGQLLRVHINASGAARTLTLTTGSTGAFAFGSDITAVTQTVSGAYDYLGFTWCSGTSHWNLIAYVKGY